MSDNAVWTGIRRGLSRRCPNCGLGPLFKGFLKVRATCPDCGNDNGAYPSDDLPPYATIAVAGHLVVPLFFWFDRAVAMSLWAQFAIWLPLTAALCVGLLPFAKGGVVGLCWGTGTVRQEIV